MRHLLSPAAAWLTLVGSNALAAPFTAESTTAVLVPEYGVTLGDIGGEVLGLGVGLTGGHTFASGAYLGGRLDAHLGSVSYFGSGRTLRIAPEAGIDVPLSDGAILRTTGWLGIDVAFVETCFFGCYVDTLPGLTLGASAAPMARVGEKLLIGGELRLGMSAVNGYTYGHVALGGRVGVSF